MIAISQPHFGEKERQYLNEALDSGFVSSASPLVAEFERAFAQHVGVTDAVACSSGTAALHLAMLAFGLNPTQSVLMPALTYVATANAVSYTGAKPVFANIDRRTWCIDVDDTARRITPSTVGIVAVHLYGVAADMARLRRLCEERGLWLVEDAAQAHCTRVNGAPAGALADIGTFSFYGNKLITCGEGGMATTNDPALADTMRRYRGQMADSRNRFYHHAVGYNYRMTGLQAALGLAQLSAISHRAASHQRVFDFYDGALSTFERQSVPAGTQRTPWLYTVLVPPSVKRDDVIDRMSAAGIETRPAFVPMTQLPMYARATPVTVADVAARGISLPTHAGLTDDQLEFIVCSLKMAVTQ